MAQSPPRTNRTPDKSNPVFSFRYPAPRGDLFAPEAAISVRDALVTNEAGQRMGYVVTAEVIEGGHMLAITCRLDAGSSIDQRLYFGPR